MDENSDSTKANADQEVLLRIASSLMMCIRPFTQRFNNRCHIMAVFFQKDVFVSETMLNKAFEEGVCMMIRPGFVPVAFTYAGIVIAMGFGGRVENTAI